MKREAVIVAFESDKSRERIRDILEGGGVAECIQCRSAAEVKRMVNRHGVSLVVCGFKLPDQSAEALFDDLPLSCAMLLVAPQSMLELCGSEDIFRLAAPVSRGDLTGSVRMLLQMGHRMERFVRPRRNREEEHLIREAKALLMDRNAMTEEQAHRFLQKRSMDSGLSLVRVARLVLDG